MMTRVYQIEDFQQNIKRREEPIILVDKGVFGICTCGGEIMFYSNRGEWQYRRGRKKNPYRLLE